MSLVGLEIVLYLIGFPSDRTHRFPKHYVSGTRFLQYRRECTYVLAKGEPKAPEHPIVDVIEWTGYTGNKLHPSQKPVPALKPLITTFCSSRLAVPQEKRHLIFGWLELVAAAMPPGSCIGK